MSQSEPSFAWLQLHVEMRSETDFAGRNACAQDSRCAQVSLCDPLQFRRGVTRRFLCTCAKAAWVCSSQMLVLTGNARRIQCNHVLDPLPHVPRFTSQVRVWGRQPLRAERRVRDAGATWLRGSVPPGLREAGAASVAVPRVRHQQVCVRVRVCER